MAKVCKQNDNTIVLAWMINPDNISYLQSKFGIFENQNNMYELDTLENKMYGVCGDYLIKEDKTVYICPRQAFLRDYTRLNAVRYLRDSKYDIWMRTDEEVPEEVEFLKETNKISLTAEGIKKAGESKQYDIVLYTGSVKDEEGKIIEVQGTKIMTFDHFHRHYQYC